MKYDARATRFVRLWALKNVFMLWLIGPKVIEVGETRCVVRIPLNWKTRNHMKSMYVGVLAVGADVSGGLIAFDQMRRRGVRAAFLFKDLHADFLKRAEGDVEFTCEDGVAIRAMLDRTIETRERQETTVTVIARVPDKLGEEPVARFTLTLSLKAR